MSPIYLITVEDQVSNKYLGRLKAMDGHVYCTDQSVELIILGLCGFSPLFVLKSSVTARRLLKMINLNRDVQDAPPVRDSRCSVITWLTIDISIYPVLFYLDQMVSGHP